MIVPFGSQGINACTFCNTATICTTAREFHRIEKDICQRQKYDIDITHHFRLGYSRNRLIILLAIVNKNLTSELMIECDKYTFLRNQVHLQTVVAIKYNDENDAILATCLVIVDVSEKQFRQIYIVIHIIIYNVTVLNNMYLRDKVCIF